MEWNKTEAGRYQLKEKILIHWFRVRTVLECALKKIILSPKSISTDFSPKKVPLIKYFRIFAMYFNKQGLKWTFIASASPKKLIRKNFETLTKNFCLCDVCFFETFCCQPTYRFCFNKWGLKIKIMLPIYLLVQKLFFYNLKYNEVKKKRKSLSHRESKPIF